MKDTGFSIEPSSMRNAIIELSVNGLVENIHNNTHNLRPQGFQEILSMKEAASHLHNSQVVTLNVVVLLQSIRCTSLMFNVMIIQESQKKLVTKLSPPINMELSI